MNKIRKIIKKILIQSDAKHIAMLSSGVLIGQIILLVVQPVTTRLYSPEAFGCLSLVVSLGTMFSPVATLQYNISIVHSPNKDEYPLCKLVLLCITVTTAILLFVLGFLLLFGDEEYKNLGAWIFVAAIIHFMTGISSLVDSYNNRHSEYSLMTKVTVQRAVFSGIVKIGLGFLKCGFPGLLISQCVGIIAGIRKQASSMIRYMKEIVHAKKRDVLNVAVKYRDQPLFALPGVFVLQFSYSALPLIINTVFSATEGGYFSLTINVLGLPLTLVSNNVARVFFKNASEEMERSRNFKSTFRTTSILLIVTSVIGFSLLWFIAEPLFSIVFGKEWIYSGIYTKMLIPMYSARFVVSGLMHGFVISKKQKIKTVLQSLFIAVMIVGYFIAELGIVTIEGFLIYINWMYFMLYVMIFAVLWTQSKKIVKVEK